MPFALVNIDEGGVQVDRPIRHSPTTENVGNRRPSGLHIGHFSISNKFLGFATINGQHYNRFPNNVSDSSKGLQQLTQERSCLDWQIGPRGGDYQKLDPTGKP